MDRNEKKPGLARNPQLEDVKPAVPAKPSP